ncbi:acyltransferase family protein [Shewanella atlantica]|uniref:Acyltransferase n=1 Tax=Shewanella atlantica TaxID=271099 RepID=A0A431WAX0_9GAMM|nr:acyltransferase family protein [Shewanella atlantica]RTR32622.1 acyltransferase [Shewanella atlantica]
MKYRPEIDGLRALAVVPVILFHAGFHSFSGGFVGVDVFFVISGYLITSIILAELEDGRFSIVNFYERRARRILPVLFFVMAACFPFAWFYLMPVDMKDFIQSLLAVSTFSSNILFWLESDYFDTAAELKPLLHTWSLAVEEQYYIFFPLFLMFTWRMGKAWVLATLVLIFLVSLGMGQWGAYHSPTAAFYLLPTRGWELLIGVFAAFYFNRQVPVLTNVWLNNLLSLAGLSLIGFSIFAFDETVPFPGVFALVPTVGTLLIILFAQQGTLVNRMLSLKLFVGIGLISYSAYLWHQPIFAFVKYTSFTEPSAELMISLCMGIGLLAYLSWRFVEKPFRNKSVYSRQFIFTSSAVVTMAFISTAGILNLSDGFKSRDIYARSMIGGYQPDNRELGADSWRYLRELSGDENYGVEQNRYDRTLWFDESDKRIRLLLVGNSHSKDMFNVLTSSEMTMSQFQVARFGAEISNIDDNLFESPNYRLADVVMFVSQYKPMDLDVFGQVIERAISDGKRTALVKNIYEFEEFGQRTYADFLFNLLLKNDGAENISSGDIHKINQKHFEQFLERDPSQYRKQINTEINTMALKYDQVLVLDRMDYVCDRPKEVCYAITDSYHKLFYDYGHHTVEGAKFFGSRIDSVNWLMAL